MELLAQLGLFWVFGAFVYGVACLLIILFVSGIRK